MSDPPDNKLHRPVEEWPLLLLGPMLRRVTEDSVSVFVALSERVNVTLKILSAPDESGEEISRSVPSNARLVTIGNRLTLCVATAFGTFQPGVIYGYDIVLGGTQEGVSLGGFGMLSGPVPIGYHVGWLPSFVLPPNRRDLKLVQASCRKPHGCHRTERLHDPDALPLVDRLIADNLENPAKRPQQLDADRRPDLLGRRAGGDARRAHVGRPRRCSAGARRRRSPTPRPRLTDDHTGSTPASAAGSSTTRRQGSPGERSDGNRDRSRASRTEDDEPLEGGNWEDYAANHLLFLGEWCAMYLMAWSPELWLDARRRRPRTTAATTRTARTYYLPPARPSTGSGLAGHDHAGAGLRRRASRSSAARSPTSRPTCRSTTTTSPTTGSSTARSTSSCAGQARGQPAVAGGRRLMRNALIAYAVFQHWGNVPSDFDPGTPGGAAARPARHRPAVDSPAATPPIGQAGPRGRRRHAARHRPGADRAGPRRRAHPLGLRAAVRTSTACSCSTRARGAVSPTSSSTSPPLTSSAAGEQRLPAPTGWGTDRAARARRRVGERGGRRDDRRRAGAGRPARRGRGGARARRFARRRGGARRRRLAAARRRRSSSRRARAARRARRHRTPSRSSAWAAAAAAARGGEAARASGTTAPRRRTSAARRCARPRASSAAALVLQAGVPGGIARFASTGLDGDFDAAAAGLWRTRRAAARAGAVPPLGRGLARDRGARRRIARPPRG